VGTVGTTGTVASLIELQEVLGPNGCGSPSSLVTYNLGIGANYGAATWYWWNAATPAWEPASGAPAQSNLRAVVETRMPAFIPTFPVGANKLFFKAFLNSPGSTPCELSNVKIKATH
jgi:hypothetical protein